MIQKISIDFLQAGIVNLRILNVELRIKKFTSKQNYYRMDFEHRNPSKLLSQ